LCSLILKSTSRSLSRDPSCGKWRHQEGLAPFAACTR